MIIIKGRYNIKYRPSFLYLKGVRHIGIYTWDQRTSSTLLEGALKIRRTGPLCKNKSVILKADHL